MTSEPGSFAQRSFQERIPLILDEAMALNRRDPQACAGLAALRRELQEGEIRALSDGGPDLAYWAAALAPYAGRAWLDAPWYLAESYLYRRVLDATGYFRPGPGEGVDPFAAKKAAEWAPDAAPRAAGALLSDLPLDPWLRFERLVHASLWGNRMDLSYMVAAHLGSHGLPADERANLMVDDTQPLWDLLQRRAGGAVALVCDNTGVELITDVALADLLLSAGLAEAVRIYLKPMPFYVSDARPGDLVAGLDSLMSGGGPGEALARRVDGHIAAGELQVGVHWALASGLFFSEMPAGLFEPLAAHDLIIFKGDVNYRRLVRDVHWHPETPFAAATAYLPTARVALRTLKCEQIVGLHPGQAEAARQEDPNWQINGQRGVIQLAI
jgi:hypothetical protein